jgi:ribosomal protein L37AE/L43A
MSAKICPRCGSASTRYRRRTDDHACKKCDFTGALVTHDERDRAMMHVITKFEPEVAKHLLDGRMPLRAPSDDDAEDGPDWMPPKGSFKKAYVEDRRSCPRCDSKGLRHRSKTDDYRCARCAGIVPQRFFEMLEQRNALTHEAARLSYKVILTRQDPTGGEGDSDSGRLPVVLAFMCSGVCGFLTWYWTADWGSAIHWAATGITGLAAFAIAFAAAVLLGGKNDGAASDSPQAVWRNEHAILASQHNQVMFEYVKRLARAASHSEARQEIHFWWRHEKGGEPHGSDGVNLTTLTALAERYADEPTGECLLDTMKMLQDVVSQVDLDGADREHDDDEDDEDGDQGGERVEEP